jgi:hypothetical protein
MKLPAGSMANTYEPAGPVTTSLRNRTPASRESRDLRVDVVDDQVNPVPSGS